MNPHADHAAAFRRLHAGGVLRLANARDAGSARLIESLGAPAIATTSAGVAWSRGYADGDELPIEHLLTAVQEIVRVIRVPLSVDVEGGYSDDPAIVADNVLRVVELGAVGINLEDGSGAPEMLCAKIAAIRQRCAAAGLDVFVNARTDVYLRGLAPPGQRVEAVLARAAQYRQAGADGLFVPGLTEANEIRAIAEDVDLPLNVMLRPNLPTLTRLESLGVRRLSAGSALSEAVFAHVRQQATAFLGGDSSISGERMGYGDINGLFQAR